MEEPINIRSYDSCYELSFNLDNIITRSKFEKVFGRKEHLHTEIDLCFADGRSHCMVTEVHNMWMKKLFRMYCGSISAATFCRQLLAPAFCDSMFLVAII